jgi:hypothetical protein
LPVSQFPVMEGIVTMPGTLTLTSQQGEPGIEENTYLVCVFVKRAGYVAAACCLLAVANVVWALSRQLGSGGPADTGFACPLLGRAERYPEGMMACLTS